MSLQDEAPAPQTGGRGLECSLGGERVNSSTERHLRANLVAFSETITWAEAIEISLGAPTTTDAERAEAERIADFLCRHGVLSLKQQASLRAIFDKARRGHGSS